MFKVNQLKAKIKAFLKVIPSRSWFGVLTGLLLAIALPAIAESPLIKNSNNPTFEKRGYIDRYHLKDSEFISLKNQTNSAATLLAKGRILYESGRFAEAAEIWQQAAKEAENQGNSLLLAQCLNALAIVEQELGDLQQATDSISKSFSLIQQSGKEREDSTKILAQTLNVQGSIQLKYGQAEAALATWKQAEATYAKAEDEMGIMGSKINQAQALQTLGIYRRAETILEEINQKLQSQPDSLLKVTGLRSLGVALSVVGNLVKSEQVLQQSLDLAQRLHSPLETSAILLSLGNTAKALQKPETALVYYQQAAASSRSLIATVEAQLNQITLLIETKQQTKAAALLPNILSQLVKLPPSRSSVYARVNFAHNWMNLKSNLNSDRKKEILEVLTEAVQQARILKDPRAESMAIGEVGQLYQENQQWEEARNLTQQALMIAQRMNAADLMAGWQWQLGQILKQQGDIKGAIAAYTEAVNALQSLRSDLVSINPDVQFSFRESVEPVYRQLVGLLLQSAQDGTPAPAPNLQQARQLIESLQLAELDNFFREACLNAKPQQIDQIDPASAVIYPIILTDRLEIILSLPGQPLRQYRVNLPQKEVEKKLDQLLEALNPVFSSPERLRLSQEVYNCLIRPAEEDLAKSGIKTLVFVLDGSLRNLPMAALFDGKQYLIEKYSLALAPGLQLLPTRQSLVKEQFKTLTAGLTESRQGFSALPGVKVEVNQIALEVPSQIFLNQDFTETNLQNQLKFATYPVIHLATHGQFSSNPEETFILTWDKKITVKEFEELLRSREQGQTNPIELLVLSACQTAAGDKRATLGLAGVALRSGARSTLATLWSVKDESTANFMAEFYRQITLPGVTKAEATRQAQLTLLKNPQFAHPFYWAPFLLVGNWL